MERNAKGERVKLAAVDRKVSAVSSRAISSRASSKSFRRSIIAKECLLISSRLARARGSARDASNTNCARSAVRRSTRRRWHVRSRYI
jgi:hypothetical protein